ncbi:hypothetical protein BJY00DRAFT_312173 [Aspergillus carlsbadensis]|nr:hypothetical protein BJY00DRAFT_312173 [Aspergillus carlsbadensis]
MDDYYMSSQVSSPSSHIIKDQYSDMSWRAYDQSHPSSIHHQFDGPHTYLDNSCFPLPGDHYTDPHQLKPYHAPDLRLIDHLASAFTTPAPTLLPSPSPGSDLGTQINGYSVESHQSTPSTEGMAPPQTTKRRAQNREAQRRFRQKKETAQKVLGEKISSLEVECNELTEQLSQKSEQALGLQRETRELEAQIQELRRNEQMLVRVVVRQPALVEGIVPALTQH